MTAKARKTSKATGRLTVCYGRDQIVLPHRGEHAEYFVHFLVAVALILSRRFAEEALGQDRIGVVDAVPRDATRAKPEAPVSVPLDWDELSPRLTSDHYTVVNLPRRLAGLRKDPWARYGTVRQALPAGRG